MLCHVKIEGYKGREHGGKAEAKTFAPTRR